MRFDAGTSLIKSSGHCPLRFGFDSASFALVQLEQFSGLTVDWKQKFFSREYAAVHEEKL